MSEMIERVARALAKLADNDNWNEFVPDARAAIEAMREPTDAMMAAVDCAGEKADWLSGRAWTAAWQAMIDEALK